MFKNRIAILEYISYEKTMQYMVKKTVFYHKFNPFLFSYFHLKINKLLQIVYEIRK
jgi:hypothetical protein